jgi:hypothetical protein
MAYDKEAVVSTSKCRRSSARTSSARHADYGQPIPSACCLVSPGLQGLFDRQSVPYPAVSPRVPLRYLRNRMAYDLIWWRTGLRQISEGKYDPSLVLGSRLHLYRRPDIPSLTQRHRHYIPLSYYRLSPRSLACRLFYMDLILP